MDNSGNNKPWYVYILRCADQSLYTGITTDPERRLAEHNGRSRGASYTRGRQPVTLVYVQPMDERSAALRREAGIKKLSRKQKESLLQSSRFDPCRTSTAESPGSTHPGPLATP